MRSSPATKSRATVAALALTLLAACGDKPAPAASTPAASTPVASTAATPIADSKAADSKAADSKAAAPSGASLIDTVAAKAAGFSVGPMMASRTVYVFFDPQCPHCGRLWEAARPLADKLRMVWIPVAILNANSAPQGAALLAATDAVATMNQHEAGIAAGKTGLVPPAQPAPELLAKVKANTELWKASGAGSVPFMLYRNPASDQVASFAGAAETPALRQMFGL